MASSGRYQYPDTDSTAPATATRELVFLVRGTRFRGHLARVISTDLIADAAGISLRSATITMRSADLRIQSASRRAQRRHGNGHEADLLASDAVPLLLYQGMFL